MEFEKLITISGQGSLFSVLSRTNFGLIAESVEDGKRIPVYQNSNVSTLQDISIYTEDGDLPLRDVLASIAEKHKSKAIKAFKDNSEYKTFFEEVVPNFEKDRVHTSDIKKIVKWYNQLVNKNFDFATLKAEEKVEEKAAEGTEEKETEKKTTKKAATKSADSTKKASATKAKTTAAQKVKNAPTKKVQGVRKAGGS